jgi:ClpP class serine protease
MSEEKQQAPISEQESAKEEEEGSSKQDTDTQVARTTTTTTNTITHQDTAIKPIVMKDNAIATTTTATTPTTTTTEFHLATQEEEDLTMKVRNAGDAFYDLVSSAIEKAKTISSQKVKEIATKDIISPAAATTKRDAKDISALGEPVESLARTFESLMTEIRKQPYSEQVNLLTGYKKLLGAQISVVDSRISMTERLK